MRLLIFAVILGTALAWKDYDGYQVLEVTPDTATQVDFLRNLMLTTDQLDFWLEPTHVNRPVQVMVGPELVKQVKEVFELHSLPVTTIHENVKDVVGDEPVAKSRTPGQFAYNYTEYNSYEEFIGELDNLNEICNSREGISCETEVIGQSYEGRDLKILKIATGATHNFWVDACIHAREWLACATVMNVVNRMLTGDSEASINVLMSHNWYILPVFNPDGYTFSWTDERFWRKSRNVNEGSTCLGTDLNRNHDYDWNTGGSSAIPCSDTYHGSSAASEPEVSTVETYTTGISNLRGWLSFHTNGQYWLVPYGNCEPDGEFGDDTQAVAVSTCDAIEATYETTWRCGNSCQVLYGTSGTTADWAMGALRVKYSYTPELRGPGFAPPAAEIPPSSEEIWNGLVAKIEAIQTIEG